jgi:DNA polymerase (family X)
MRSGGSHKDVEMLGCMFSINPDAHTVEELDLTCWGLLAARKGGIPRDRVLNCLSGDDLERVLRARRVSSLTAF